MQEHCDRLRSELQDVLDGCTSSARGLGVRKGLRVPWAWVCRCRRCFSVSCLDRVLPLLYSKACHYLNMRLHYSSLGVFFCGRSWKLPPAVVAMVASQCVGRAHSSCCASFHYCCSCPCSLNCTTAATRTALGDDVLSCMIRRSIIETVQKYPSGLTKAVILAELELLW